MIKPILTSQYMEAYQNKTNFYGFEILTNQLGFYFDYFSFKLFATDWLNGSQSQYWKIMVWKIHWVGNSVIFFELSFYNYIKITLIWVHFLVWPIWIALFLFFFFFNVLFQLTSIQYTPGFEPTTFWTLPLPLDHGFLH